MRIILSALLTVLLGIQAFGQAIPGTVVAAKITTGDEANTFSIGDTAEMKGTPKQVADTAARDLIPAARRTEGMEAWVVSEGKAYRLVGGILNDNWVEVVSAATAALTGRTLWVDSVNGNDEAASRGSAALQWSTFGLAVSNALAGDLVRVRPGTYDWTNTVLVPDDVNVRFEPGAIFRFWGGSTNGSGNVVVHVAICPGDRSVIDLGHNPHVLGHRDIYGCAIIGSMGARGNPACTNIVITGINLIGDSDAIIFNHTTRCSGTIINPVIRSRWDALVFGGPHDFVIQNPDVVVSWPSLTGIQAGSTENKALALASGAQVRVNGGSLIASNAPDGCYAVSAQLDSHVQLNHVFTYAISTNGAVAHLLAQDDGSSAEIIGGNITPANALPAAATNTWRTSFPMNHSLSNLNVQGISEFTNIASFKVAPRLRAAVTNTLVTVNNDKRAVSFSGSYIPADGSAIEFAVPVRTVENASFVGQFVGNGVNLTNIASTNWFDIAEPNGWTWNLPFTVQQSGTNFRASPAFDLRDHANIPVSVTYYVDRTNGNNANSGLTMALALADVKTAYSKADVDRIVINKGYYFYNEVNASPTRSMEILATNGVVSITADVRNEVGAFTLVGSHYEAEVSGSRTVTLVHDLSNLDTLGLGEPLTLVGSSAAVDATANTFYQSGTTIYVRTSDSRAPDASLVYFIPAYAFSVTQNSKKFFVDGITFHALENNNLSSVGGLKTYYRNCTLTAAQINGTDETIFQNCTIGGSSSDGLSYSILNTVVPKAIEIDVHSFGHGLGTTDQASTTHNGTTIVRINGDYHHVGGQAVADVDAAKTWMLGSAIHNATNGTGFYTAGTAWLDNVYSYSNTIYDLQNTSGSVIHVKDFVGAKGVNDIVGTLSYYYPVAKPGIYQSDSSATNFVAGSFGIGVKPTEKLEVGGGNIALSSTGVTQPTTLIAAANTFGLFKVREANQGGLEIHGLTDHISQIPLLINGNFGNTDPDDSSPGILFAVSKSDGGTSRSSLGASETAFSWYNYTTARMTMLGSGSLGLGTETPTEKLEVSGGSIALSSAGVTQPTTSIAAANVFGLFKVRDANQGGLEINGITDHISQIPLLISGIFGNTDPENSTSAVLIAGAKNDGGAFQQALASDETLFSIFNYTTPRLTMLGSGATTFAADVSVPDEAYGVGWNASLEVPTKNALYDKIEAIVGGGSTNRFYEAGEVNHWVELGGTNGDPFLVKGANSSTTDSVWQIDNNGNFNGANLNMSGSVTLPSVFGAGLAIPYAISDVLGGVAGLTPRQSIRVDAAGTGFEAYTAGNLLTATATLNFGSILAAASEDLPITVTGAAVGDAVHIGLPAAPAASVVFMGFVSAADTVTIRAFNVGTIAADPASATYRAVVTHY